MAQDVTPESTDQAETEVWEVLISLTVQIEADSAESAEVLIIAEIDGLIWADDIIVQEAEATAIEAVDPSDPDSETEKD
jgi:hypothetical protein